MLNPIVDDGEILIERDNLSKRRRKILFPETIETLPRLWPPLETIPADLVQAGNASVAVVVMVPLNPDGYEPVARYTAELVSVLVKNNVKTTLLDLTSDKETKEVQSTIKTHWPQGSVKYERIDPPAVPLVNGPLALVASMAYRLYEWLKRKTFDVIHAPDFYGSLYFCLSAKQQGIAFEKTRFVVHPAGGILQSLLQDYNGINSINLLPRIYLERSSLELADTVSLPGRFALRKLLDAGIQLMPGYIEHYPYPFDYHAVKKSFDVFRPDNMRGPLKRVLCLPGASRRGIALFCKAMERGFKKNINHFKVEFALPANFDDSLGALIDALTSASDGPTLVQTIHDKESLVRILGNESETLCVFPAVDEWNYCQVAELAILGVPLLVADPIQAAEILDKESLKYSTCSPLPDAMGKRIRSMLDHRESVPEPNREIPMPATWVTPSIPRTSLENSTERPLVTVCLMHFERPHLVEQALASVESQTYANFEVVLIDDGSLNKEAIRKLKDLEARFQKTGWRVVRQQNRYLGAARNTAAINARGRYLYFLDDDNVLKPHALETFVNVAEYMSADVVAAFSDVLEGNQAPNPAAHAPRRIIQIGDDLAYGFFRNAFGDSNSLIRRSTFLALGGNTEDYAVGLDDQEFFARAILNGYRLTVIPEALYWARQMPTRLRNLHFNPRAGSIRVCRAYLPHVPAKLRPMLLLVSGVMESRFEGKNITLRDYFTSLKIRVASTRIGSWVRASVLGFFLHKVLVWFNLNDS